MSIRAYKWILALLVCIVVALGWRWYIAESRMGTAAFMDHECEITQTRFIDRQSDPTALAHRLAFLIGYYDTKSQTLSGSPIAKIVERHYLQTLTNAVVAFRRMSTNDLGTDPRAWVQKYGP